MKEMKKKNFSYELDDFQLMKNVMHLQSQQKQIITNYKYYFMIVSSMKYNIFIEYFSG